MCTLSIALDHRQTKDVCPIHLFSIVFDDNKSKKPNCLSFKHFREHKCIIPLNSIVFLARLVHVSKRWVPDTTSARCKDMACFEELFLHRPIAVLLIPDNHDVYILLSSLSRMWVMT